MCTYIRSIARLVEILAHPILVFSYTGIIITLVGVRKGTIQWTDFLFGGGFFLLFCVLSFFLKRFDKGEMFQYFLPSLLLVITFGVFNILVYSFPREFLLMAISLFLILTIIGLIRFYWLISNHCAFSSFCFTLLFLIVDFNLIFLFLLLPIVAWSRIELKRHDVPQVIAGSLFGLIIPILSSLALS